MLAYKCKQCKKMTVSGYINEFNEHFCSERCYKTYCEENNYIVNWSNLKTVRITIDNNKK